MGLKAPSLNLLMTPNRVMRWTRQKGETSYRETWAGWKSGPARTLKFSKDKFKLLHLG